MKCYKNIIVIICFFVFAAIGGKVWGQSTLTVNDGSNTSSFVPVYGTYCDAYLKCEFVIPAAGLTAMTGKDISGMKFYLSTQATGSWGNANFQIFMKEVDNTAISSYNGTTGATIVYVGSLDGTSSELEINFNSDYSYDGGNLLIGVYNTVKGSFSGCGFYGLTSTSSCVQGYSTTDLNSISPNQRNFLPKITFTYDVRASCAKPTGLTVSTITANSATLTWAPGGSESSWEYSFNNGSSWNTFSSVSGTTLKTADISGLSANTAYSICIRANCGSEYSNKTSSVPFRTACGEQSVPYSETFESYSSGLPSCWEKVGSGSVAVQMEYPNQGAKSLKFSGVANGNIVALPKFNENTSLLTVSFYTRPERQSSYCGSIEVGYITDLNDPTTFRAIESYSYSEWDALEYEQKEVFMSGAPADSYIAFNHKSGSAYYFWFVDDINVEISCTSRTGSFAFETTSAAMYVGNTLNVSSSPYLSNSVSPSGTVEWSSSNTSVATVSNDGIVTGVSAGEATIFAKISDAIIGSVDYCEVSAVFTITVNCYSPTLELDHTSETLSPNSPENILDITAISNSAGSISWSSSNPSVATVEAVDATSGRVTAIGEGNCVVTATIAGSGLYCEKSVSCNIHVTCDGCARVGWGNKSNASENLNVGGVYFYKSSEPSKTYSYTQQIYTAEEIRMAGGGAGVVDSIKVHHNGGNVTTKSDVFIGLTTQSDFQNGWVDYGLTQVVNNQNIVYGNGWTKIDIHSAGFEWDGETNIVVAFRNHIESGSNGYCLNDDDRGNDKYNYCTSSSQIGLTGEHVPTSLYGSTTSHRNNIKFCISPCDNPMDAYFSENEMTIRIGGGSVSTILRTNPSEGVTITYTSSNPSVATVSSSGVVSPIEEGSAIIIAHVTKTGYCSANAYLSVSVCNCGSGEEPYRVGSESRLETIDKSIYGPVCNVNSGDNDGHKSYRQIIYRAGELHAGTIKSIAFEYSTSTPMTHKNNVKIYMAAVDKSEFTSRTDWVAHSNFTEVYSGNLNCSRYGWNKFNLTTPYVYDGCKNLVVAIYDNSNEVDATECRFLFSNANDNVQLFNNGAVPNQSGDDYPGLASGSFGANEHGITSYFPNTKFCIVTSASGGSYTLSYDITGNCTGVGATATSTEITSVIGVSETTVTNTIPLCTKYAGFHAWNTEADGSGIYYYPGDNIKLCKNETLHAIYNDNVNGESSCENAVAFCNSSNSISFHVDEAPGELYGNFCNFFSTPATWWYMQIDQPGDLFMTIESSVGDVDMACWGPFDNVTCDLSDLSDEGALGWDYYIDPTLHYSNTSTTPLHNTSTPICDVYTLARPSGNLVDYGGSTSSKEYLQIIDAQHGEYYMVIVANYANRPGEITFTQTGGAGRASCDIVNNCDITSISASTTCTSTTTYDVSGEIAFRDAPVDGTLTVTIGGYTLPPFTPPFSSPISYSKTGLSANGEDVTITATFTSSTINCSKTSSYIAPTKIACGFDPLPVELLSLHATCNGKRALISWTTASERNNDYFVVERSDDAVNFVEIGRVAGAGNSIEMLSYNYADYSIRTGENYYRLTQVDYDGSRTTSEIIEVHCSGNVPLGDPDVYVYPNPFGDELTVHLVNFGDVAAHIQVYDMLGRMLFERTAYPTFNDSEIVLQLGGLPDAAYTVRVSTSEFVVNKKVVKNK